MGLEGLEPPTLGSEDRCSIQLSYRPKAGKTRGFSTPAQGDPRRGELRACLAGDG